VTKLFNYGKIQNNLTPEKTLNISTHAAPCYVIMYRTNFSSRLLPTLYTGPTCKRSRDKLNWCQSENEDETYREICFCVFCFAPVSWIHL